jgi:hypothetical protein
MHYKPNIALKLHWVPNIPAFHHSNCERSEQSLKCSRFAGSRWDHNLNKPGGSIKENASEETGPTKNYFLTTFIPSLVSWT